MNVYDFALKFADAHWFLTFLVIVGLCSALSWPFKLIARFIRHLNIRKAGWPPPHVDADGDFREVE